MKKILSLMLTVLLGLAWYVTISSWFGNEGKYQGYLEEAQRLEGKGLYIDAISIYEEAKGLTQDNLELEEYIADDYLAMGNYTAYKQQLGKIISTYGPVEADVKRAYEFYSTYSSKDSLINYLVDLYAQYPDNALVKEYYNSIKGTYSEMYLSLEAIGTFVGNGAAFTKDGKQGVLNVEGQTIIQAVYDEILYNGQNKDRITVKDGGDYYFIDSNGYKTAEPEGDYDYIGFYSSSRIPAGRDGKFGYLDGNLKEKIAFEYDAVSAFNDGTAAVKKGDKWALINEKGEALTEYLYDDVALNSRGFCSVNDAVWVKQGGSWFLINSKGEAAGTESYEDVKAFESGEPCAVCLDGKWGYADNTGNLVINCTYQDAKSFAEGFAPVEKNGLWGYIDLENYLMLSYSFAEAGQMTSGGVAPVSHGDAWTLIKLKALN